jgi:prepilin-type N-terminal cleavage/methylation domain-containing protein
MNSTSKLNRWAPGLPTNSWCKARGFSLLEIILVLSVIAILTGVLLPSARGIITQSQRDAESQALNKLAELISASFESPDLSLLNIAAFPGSIGPADSPTLFSDSTIADYGTTTNSHWFAKVARAQGITPQIGVAPSTSSQPELARIAYNQTGNPRWLFAAPAESGKQRFLLVSLSGRREQLTVPVFESTVLWFDAIWNHDWESRTAGLPDYWVNRLSPDQVAAWLQSPGGLSRVNQFCVQRIVLPKYRLSVNNNHPTEHAFVSYHNQPAVFTAAANTGANLTPEILSGRLVTINRGSVWPGIEALRFHLRENATVTVQ